MNLRPTLPARADRERSTSDIKTLADMISARVHVDVTIPRTTIQAKLRLCSRSEEFEAKAAARRAMIEGGYPVNSEALGSPGTTEQWQIEVAAHMLAIAVRDPGNVERSLATLEEWRGCDDLQLLTLWNTYTDLEQRLDPIGVQVLTDAEFELLAVAAKKKDRDSLMSFGSSKLALFAITSAERPASSETPKSSSGPTPS